MLELLLRHRADVNATNVQQRSPLAVLCSTPLANQDEVALVNLGLLDALFYHPEKKKREGRSLAVARVLLDAGADISSLDENRQDPCDLAGAIGNDHLVSFLVGDQGSAAESTVFEPGGCPGFPIPGYIGAHGGPDHLPWTLPGGVPLGLACRFDSSFAWAGCSAESASGQMVGRDPVSMWLPDPAALMASLPEPPPHVF